VLHEHIRSATAAPTLGIGAAMTRSLNQYIESNEIAKKAKVEPAATTCARAFPACFRSRCRSPNSRRRPKDSWSRRRSGR